MRVWPGLIGLCAGLFPGGFALAAGAGQAAPACDPDRAQFPAAGLSVQVEIADDEAERALGLMMRDSLPADSGMLFIYESPRAVAFWMKNTLIPLDMVFMDDRGIIRHIHPRAVPLDLTPVPGNLPDDPAPERLMVLEIGGGEAARLGLQPGMAMAHPRLDQARAAIPCG